MPASQQRDVIKELSPPWLAQGNNERFLYVLGLGSDSLIEKCNQGMRARFPPYAPVSALPYLGADRVMAQGPNETEASFRIRLQTAYETWQRAGSRRAVMGQALTYAAGVQEDATTQIPQSVSVSNDSNGDYANWDTYYNTSDRQLPPAHAVITPSNWDWDGDFRPKRVFLIMFFDGGEPVGPEEDDWGVGTWGDGGSWGLDVTPNFISNFRSLIKLWKNANSYYQWFIFSFNPGTGSTGDDFSPNSAQGAGNPDGTWGTWGYVAADGVYRPVRNPDARYVDGTGQYAQCYVHNRT